MNKKSTFSLSVLAVCLFSSVFTTASAVDSNSLSAESKAALAEQRLGFGKKSMVVTNNPWSSQAAQDILAKGGSATDAAIAAAFVLGLTEPQSSGIGGGGYAVSYHDKKLIAYDGREVAPHSATPAWFLTESGQPLDFRTAWLSSRSVGVPGEIAMFYKMHQQSGKLKWAELLQPAIKLAKNGFPMSKILYKELLEEQDVLVNNPAVVKIYFNADKTIKPIGQMIKNPAYAETLAQVAKTPDNFYSGKIAKDIVKVVNDHAQQKLFTLKDLSNYRALSSNALCSDYRGGYQLCSVPPSSSGGVTSQELVKLFANKYKSTDVTDSKWVYTFLEASKLAYADRNQYLADPKFVKQPVGGLLDANYLSQRSELITESALATPVVAGVPAGIDTRYAPDVSPKPHGTTSISVVDKNGNAVSMTVTVENTFGSHLFVDGFFLNNELTDFSFESVTASGKPIANRVEADKRPRSSISPTIVLDKNKQLYAVAGSPGGSFIICTVARNLILMLDFKLNPYEAAAYPNFCAINNDPIVESGDSVVSVMVPQLESYGEVIQRKSVFSGEANIIRDGNGWAGGADPRREGVALGENDKLHTSVSWTPVAGQ